MQSGAQTLAMHAGRGTQMSYEFLQTRKPVRVIPHCKLVQLRINECQDSQGCQLLQCPRITECNPLEQSNKF